MVLETPIVSESELKYIEDTFKTSLSNSLVGRLVLEIRRIKNETFYVKSEYEYYFSRYNTISKLKDKLGNEIAEYYEFILKLKNIIENNLELSNNKELSEVLSIMTTINKTHGDAFLAKLKYLNDEKEFQVYQNTLLIKENIHLRERLEKTEKELSNLEKGLLLHSKLFLNLKSFFNSIQTEDLVSIKTSIGEILSLKKEESV